MKIESADLTYASCLVSMLLEVEPLILAFIQSYLGRFDAEEQDAFVARGGHVICPEVGCLTSQRGARPV